MRALGSRLWNQVLHTEASTRSAALMRIALVAVVWARWADELVVSRHLGDGLWPFSIAFYAVTTLAFFGLWTRISVAATAGAALFMVYYVGHELGAQSNTHHHATLLAWACVWLALRRAERRGLDAPPEIANVWALRLLALQTSAVYFWTALEKCNLGFLSGARLQHLTMYFYAGSSPISELPIVPIALAIIAPLVVLLEISLAFGMLFARTRKWLVLPGLLLHGSFYALLSVSTFSITMWALYLAYFDPNAVHALLDRLQGREREPKTPPA